MFVIIIVMIVYFFFQKPTPNLLGTISQKQIGVSIFKMEVKKQGNENIKSNGQYK